MNFQTVFKLSDPLSSKTIARLRSEFGRKVRAEMAATEKRLGNKK